MHKITQNSATGRKPERNRFMTELVEFCAIIRIRICLFLTALIFIPTPRP